MQENLLDTMLHQAPGRRVSSPIRDAVDGLTSEIQEPPPIVSISDVHGYLDEARSALLTLADHPEYEPVVLEEGGSLHWANENYVLVFNGDLIDRGPNNEEVLEMVARLIEEAPPGRVRVILGNHEAIVLSADHFGFPTWYSGQAGPDERQTLSENIVAGHVVAAYRGYNVTYAHAGSPEPYDVTAVNDALVDAAQELNRSIGTIEAVVTQQRILDSYSRVLGVGDGNLKGPNAGLAWLDWSYLPAGAPPQVVGHTRHRTPQQKGNVFCQNVLRDNLNETGGEAVFIESPNHLSALTRQADGSVEETELVRFVE